LPNTAQVISLHKSSIFIYDLYDLHEDGDCGVGGGCGPLLVAAAVRPVAHFVNHQFNLTVLSLCIAQCRVR
jgi:hypothetical protein